MKKLITYLAPLFIALFSFVFYIIIYNPGVKSEDFTTALLVFFAVLGASAITLFSTKETRFVLLLYVSFSIFLPAILLFFIKITTINNPFHPIILVLMILGFTCGKLFVATHMNQKKKNRNKGKG